MTFPFPIADEQQNALTEKLMKLVMQLQDQNILLKEHAVQQRKRIAALEAEIIRLKKLNPKPDTKPNTKPSDDSDSDSENSNNDDSSPDIEQPKG